MLQWGRTLSSAESEVGPLQLLEHGGASMGPHSFKCGKWTPPPRTGGPSSSFNGAALFQVRKDASLLGKQMILRYASMGPHSFKCGKDMLPFSLRFPAAQLQWGRTLSSAESLAEFVN